MGPKPGGDIKNIVPSEHKLGEGSPVPETGDLRFPLNLLYVFDSISDFFDLNSI